LSFRFQKEKAVLLLSDFAFKKEKRFYCFRISLSKRKSSFIAFRFRFQKRKADFFIFRYIIMKYLKKAKRGYRKASKFVKKVNRHPVTKGLARVAKLASNVQMLMHLANIEKKRFDRTQTVPQAVAQLATTGISGQFAVILTPTPSQGVSGTTRVGNSIKVVSGCLDMQFHQQSGAINDIKIKWYLVCRPDNAANYTPTTAIAEFFEPNPFSGVNDYWSSRDPEFFSAFKVIKSGVVDLKQDAITNGNSIKQIKVPLKFNHHLKFNTDGTVITTKNQFYLFAVASAGDNGALSGAYILYNMRWYYTDN